MWWPDRLSDSSLPAFGWVSIKKKNTPITHIFIPYMRSHASRKLFLYTTHKKNNKQIKKKKKNESTKKATMMCIITILIWIWYELMWYEQRKVDSRWMVCFGVGGREMLQNEWDENKTTHHMWSRGGGVYAGLCMLGLGGRYGENEERKECHGRRLRAGVGGARCVMCVKKEENKIEEVGWGKPPKA